MDFLPYCLCFLLPEWFPFPGSLFLWVKVSTSHCGAPPTAQGAELLLQEALQAGGTCGLGLWSVGWFFRGTLLSPAHSSPTGRAENCSRVSLRKELRPSDILLSLYPGILPLSLSLESPLAFCPPERGRHHAMCRKAEHLGFSQHLTHCLFSFFIFIALSSIPVPEVPSKPETSEDSLKLI